MSIASETTSTKRSGCGASRLTSTIQPGAFAGPGAIHFERKRDVAERCNLLLNQASICEFCQPPVDRKRGRLVRAGNSCPRQEIALVRWTDCAGGCCWQPLATAAFRHVRIRSRQRNTRLSAIVDRAACMDACRNARARKRRQAKSGCAPRLLLRANESTP
jgi:hypothetical protein